MSLPRLLRLLVIPCLLSCQEQSTTAISPQPTMEVGPGLSELLPHQAQGSLVKLTVSVTASGRPAPGLEVHWYDGRSPTGLSTRLSLTDDDGIAETTWTLPYIPATAPFASYWVQVTMPGAAGNPILYTIEVYRCTREPCPGG